ncbi:MAG: hypothetical protein LUB62_00525, partial [Prevotellaceae bacterium]|nr:hypothetical protein [Prevotellaceae bacterium]
TMTTTTKTPAAMTICPSDKIKNEVCKCATYIHIFALHTAHFSFSISMRTLYDKFINMFLCGCHQGSHRRKNEVCSANLYIGGCTLAHFLSSPLLPNKEKTALSSRTTGGGIKRAFSTLNCLVYLLFLVNCPL